MRFKTHLFAVFLVLLFPLATAVSPAPETPTPLQGETILKNIEDQIADIQDLQALIAFTVLTNKFIKFPVTFHADYYFKSPDKVKIKFRGLPRLFLSDAPKAVTAATTLTGFPRNYASLYDIKILGIRNVERQNCYYLQLIPKKSDGNVARTFLWVNQKTFTVPKLSTEYKDKSWIHIKRVYKPLKNYFLVKDITSDMKFVQGDLEAHVQARFENYVLNQGLSDTLFEDGKK